MLIELARERGIRRFEAEVLANNTAMLKVFRRNGLPMHKHNEVGVVRVQLEVDAAVLPAAKTYGSLAMRAVSAARP